MMFQFGSSGYLNLSDRNLFVVSDNIKNEIKNNFDAVSVIFSNNALHEIPEDVKYLPFSEYLDFSSNNIVNISNLKYFNFLTYLNLNNNNLAEIQNELCSLKSLKILKISNNKIKKFPDRINDLKNIEEIIAENNLIETFHNNICKLNNLRIVNLRLNRITLLPPDISLLVSLERLDLAYNNISNLESDIYKLYQLQELIIDGNPIVFPPLFICHMGTKAIMDYLTKSANKRMALINKKYESKSKSPNYLIQNLKNLNVECSNISIGPLSTSTSSQKEDLKDTISDDPKFREDIKFVKSALARRNIITLDEDENIFPFLSDGIYLCKLMKSYKKTVNIIFLSPSPDRRLSSDNSIKNIQQFLAGCEDIGIKKDDSCTAQQILSGTPSIKVLSTIIQFIRKCESS